VGGHLNTIVEKGAPLPAKQVQSGRQRRRSPRSEQSGGCQTSRFIGSLAGWLAAEIVEPQEGKTYTGQATLSFGNQGADANFVTASSAFPTALDC